MTPWLPAFLQPGRRQRRWWRSDERVHIEVRGVHDPDRADFADRVAEATERLESVHWARAVPAIGRIVVACDGGDEVVDEVIELLEALEQEEGLVDERFAEAHPEHPADREMVFRQQIGLVADVAGMGFAFIGSAARFARLPIEVASVVTTVQSQLPVRQVLERHLGTTTADVWIATSNAVVNALLQGPLGLSIDIAHHYLLLQETNAAARAWAALEPELTGSLADSGPAVALTSAGPPPARTPADNYSRRAGIAAAGGFASVLVATLDPRRAIAVGLAATPKGATVGEDAFCALLGRTLAERGIVWTDARALRRLAAINTLCVPGSALRTGRRELQRILTNGDTGDGEAGRVARELFDGDRPDTLHEQGEWRLGPVAALGEVEIPDALGAALGRRSASGVLGVARNGRLAAIALLADEMRPGALALIAAARGTGLMVAIADTDQRFCERVGGDLLVEDEDGLAASVEMMQGDDFAVLLVGSDDHEALRTATCSIGLIASDRAAPWAADLLTNGGLEDAAAVVTAAHIAQEVGRQSAALALGGSSIGAVLALTGPRGQASRRALNAVNVAAIAAIVNALRAERSESSQPVPPSVVPPPWHELDIDEVLLALDTTAEGLTAPEAAGRRTHRTRDEQASLPRMLLDELANPLTPVLTAGAAISAALGSVADAGLVGSVLGFNAAIGAAQRRHVERSVWALERSASQQVPVLRRGGEPEIVAETDVVFGDVVRLMSGDAVPADCRVLAAVGLEVDESALTGESLPVGKTASPSFAEDLAGRTSMLYEGTSVVAGGVDAVVVAVGDATEAGRARVATGPVRASGVEARLDRLTRTALPAAVGGGALVAVAGLLRGIPLQDSLRSAVSLAVAAVPEGLPLIATMAQLAAAGRLAERGALVRDPRAIEALGRVEVLCVDKTGTLTRGRIELRRVYDGRGELALDELDDWARQIIAAGVRASPLDGGAVPHFTDQAVLTGASDAGIGAELGVSGWESLTELPFEPRRGYHATFGTNGGDHILSVKGAPEVVLPRCRVWADRDGTHPLDDAARRRWAAEVDDLAGRGYRVLAVAERVASDRQGLEDDRVERLTLLGLLGLSDPVRDTAADAVNALQAAGVRVVMVTGDHPSTAERIADSVGLGDGGRVLLGPELDRLGDHELDAVLDEIELFARVTPAHKVRIVAAYQRRGMAVAMTGDGANDAPAIRLADAGIALGRRSTSAARSAADVVVPDGRIETVVDAIIEGRALWASVREALALLLGGNLGETAFVVGGTLVSGRPPLSPRQILLVNLLTDVAPAVTIAMRPPRQRSGETLLAEGPEASLGGALNRAIVNRAIATASGAGAAWLAARATGRRRRADTVGLVALVGGQMGQTLLAGGRDPAVAAAAVGSTAVLAAIVATPVLSQFFDCTPLGPVGWAMALSGAAGATGASVVIPPVWSAVERAVRPAPTTSAAGPADGRPEGQDTRAAATER